MPIYEFECAGCGHRFDRLQKLADPDPRTCPACGAEQVQRRVSAPTFRLAGGGWYETDFKKEGEKKQHLAGDRDTAGGKADGAKAAGESKPAAESPKSAPPSPPSAAAAAGSPAKGAS